MVFSIPGIRQVSNVCSQAYCGHGVCQEFYNEYYCLCDNGWTGLDCDTCKLISLIELVVSGLF